MFLICMFIYFTSLNKNKRYSLRRQCDTIINDKYAFIDRTVLSQPKCHKKKGKRRAYTETALVQTVNSLD